MGLKLIEEKETRFGTEITLEGNATESSIHLPHLVDHDSVFIAVDHVARLLDLDYILFDTDSCTVIQLDADVGLPSTVTINYLLKPLYLTKEEKITLVKRAFGLSEEEISE